METKLRVGPVGQSLPELLAHLQPSRIFLLADTNTRQLCLPYLQEQCPALRGVLHYTMPAGEPNKTLSTTEQLWQAMLSRRLDRRAVMINLGGGVVTDLGGFAAGCYKRGIRFVHLPTTLLGQVDAAIGGKTGLDFGGIKNSIGLFRAPEAVLSDAAFLTTLPARQLRSGLAEMLKHALIRDADHWQQLQELLPLQDNSSVALEAAIAKSQHIKLAVVRSDPYEQGPREALNFGHSIGHAIESYFLYGVSGTEPVLHGEAIAAGMLCETYLSEQYCRLSAAAVAEIERVLFGVFGTLPLSDAAVNEIISLAANDKKNQGGKLRMALLNAIGSARVGITVLPEDAGAALQRYIRQSRIYAS